MGAIETLFSWLDPDWVSEQFANGDGVPLVVWTLAALAMGFAVGRAWRNVPVRTTLSSLSPMEKGAVAALFDLGYMRSREGDDVPDVFERLRHKGVVSVEATPYAGSAWTLERRFRTYLARHNKVLRRFREE